MNGHTTRRTLLKLAGAGVAAASLTLPGKVFAQGKDELTIAYNVNLPSWDPTVGPSAVNPTIQGFYQSVFDMFIHQNPDLSFAPGLITEWGWNDDRSKIFLVVREGVKWHNGSPFTAEDVAWSLARAGKAETGNPIQFVWSKVGNFKVTGNRVEADVIEFEPTIFKWMSFLTGYVLPKAYYEKVGAEGFEAKPIGTGPYMVDRYERNAFVRLKANPDYWGGKPDFETVTIKFVTDAASRVAEIESGNSDVTLEIPYEEYDRLIGGKLKGSCETISDIAMIFINDVDPMLDKNVRLGAIKAIDKQLLIDRLLRGYGVPLATLETPEYAAYDASIKVESNAEEAKKLLAASGYSPEKPVKFKIQTTRGFKPKDYEMIQAIVGMWRKVGIEARSKSTRSRSTMSCAPPTSWRQPPFTTGATPSAIRPPRPALPCSARARIPCGTARISSTASSAVGREGRGQAYPGLERRRPLHRRGRAGDPAAAICAADRAPRRPEGDAAQVGCAAAAPHQTRIN